MNPVAVSLCTTGLSAALMVLQEQIPSLAFYPVAPEQPHRVNGLPVWRDTVFARHDTIIVRHLRERRATTWLEATLHSYGNNLELRVKEESSRLGYEGVAPGGAIQSAYEARIGPLSPGVYAVILRDEGFGRRLKPFTLRRAVGVTRLGPVVTVRGRIVDDYSGRPVPHAAVDVPEVDAPGYDDPVEVDSAGRFEIRVPGPRKCVRLRVRAIGFHSTEKTIDLASGRRLELGDIPLRAGVTQEGGALILPPACRTSAE